MQRVVESGCAIGPKVFENLVILLGDPNPWYVRARTEDLALRNLRFFVEAKLALNKAS